MSLDPYLHRGISPEEFEHGDEAQLFCWRCEKGEFQLVAVRNDRHIRIVCCDCGAGQSEFTALWLGTIDGTA